MELPHSDCIIGLVDSVKTLFDNGNIPFISAVSTQRIIPLTCIVLKIFKCLGNQTDTKRTERESDSKCIVDIECFGEGKNKLIS